MPTHPDTEPNLRAALNSAAVDPNYWESPTGRVILDHALDSLRPLALRFHADPADALSHAFETWMGMPAATLTDGDADLWAYTRAAVRRCLAHEEEANRRGMSVAGIRRSGARDIDITTGIDGIDVGYDPAASSETPEPTLDLRSSRAQAALEQVLLITGLTEDQRSILIDVFADLVETSPSPRSSIDRAIATRDIIAPDMAEGQWRNLVEVILGTPAGLPGVLALAGNGHPAPAMEPHISSRLMGVLALAA